MRIICFPYPSACLSFLGLHELLLLVFLREGEGRLLFPSQGSVEAVLEAVRSAGCLKAFDAKRIKQRQKDKCCGVVLVKIPRVCHCIDRRQERFPGLADWKGLLFKVGISFSLE